MKKHIAAVKPLLNKIHVERIIVGNAYASAKHPMCFCYKVYFFSNFKDFNTIAPA